MRLISMTPVVATLFAVAGLGASAASASPTTRISGPHVHDNLAVYFLHGPSAGGAVPLTLAEALAKGGVKVIETGNVNALEVENLGTEDVFIQSGDIVKGGRQDRVLTVSLLLPSKSGKVSIDSFCVEHGRWAPRGKEDSSHFASSGEALPSREAKLAMYAPPKAVATSGAGSASVPAEPSPAGQLARNQMRQGTVSGGRVSETAQKQRKVWDEVANIQAGLSSRLGAGAKVAAPLSATSLQLSLENDALKSARATYLSALKDKPSGQDDIVGFVFAIDGKINSADVYPSHALFEKMWTKLLAASVTEAIGAKARTTAAAAANAPPATGDVEAFLSAAEGGAVHQASIAKLMTQETRDAERSLYVEAKRADGAWVHRNYLAK
jgi:hypothetical protein